MTNNNEKQVQKVISKQLLKNPVFDNDLHISYYSEKILEQIHIDTMFWMVADGVDYDDPKLLPILVIVDVSTRFTQFYYQKRKSEKILEHLTSFIKDVKSKFKNKNTATNSILICDGAREFIFLQKKPIVIDGITITTKLSTGVNKSVFAEVAIMRVRKVMKQLEVEQTILNVVNDTDWRIDKKNLQEILNYSEDILNKDVHQLKEKNKKRHAEVLNIGTPVFVINLFKYFPYQYKSVLRKTSYDTNWMYEPFYIDKVFGIDGIFKYKIKSYVVSENQEMPQYFWRDQLQPIKPEYASRYIENYLEKIYKKIHTNNN